MGFFDDILPPDAASSYVATPRVVPRITVRPKGVEPPPGFGNAQTPADASDATDNAAPAHTGLFDNIVLPAARADELAQHKAAIESALSNTVPLRLQHSRPVDIAAGLMADHGLPLDEALDRATMRLHAEENTAEAGKINDVIGKDAFNEAQHAPASPDFTQPAPGIGESRATPEEQARPDGEYTSGDREAQGSDAAGGRTIGSEDAARAEQRAQSRDEPTSAAVEGEEPAERLRFGDSDEIVARPPAGPPDTAAAQSDRMNSGARESGPFTLDGREQGTFGSEYLGRANGVPAEAHALITSYAGDPVKTRPNDKAGEADSAARADELAQHKAAVESALSNTVPLRLQHSRPVEIAARLMADHGMPLDEALDRATMQLHAEEGTAALGKISDVIGQDAFDEAQRVAADDRTAEFVGRAASPDLAQPAQSSGRSRAAIEAQTDPDGEYSLGAHAPRGEGAGGKAIGSEGAGPIDDRAARA
jgi:hypothetical protein